MVDFNLINDLDTSTEDFGGELAALFGGDPSDTSVGGLTEAAKDEYRPGTILTGRVIGHAGDDIVVDVGLKSEGIVPAAEWENAKTVEPGEEVQVWLEAVESDTGTIVLSKRKADRILNWQRLVATKNEGDKVSGVVMRKIKGGLLVDIGYPVFLPASQVDIRRPGDIGELIGETIEAKILKIDVERRNIVVSRRKLIEDSRTAAKKALLTELEEGQTRKGVVKNLADFGAFVDLGGIDGLLHITDMSWDRVNHPQELLKIDDEIEVKVLNIDREKEKIALGLKQLTPNPWEEISRNYPVGSKIKGEVVNIMNYGAFVKLEPGVEGLVHISEMSWTRRINHPSDVLSVGDVIDVVVLDIHPDKQEISLGIKQTQVNPWTQVAEKYPPNTRIKGRVRNLTNYGAFVEIEEGVDGLLHVSDLSWTKKITHPSEVLKKGEEIECVVLKVDQENQRIALGLKQLHEDPWARAVPENYIPGQIVEGAVTKITNFGVFVELEDDLEGLLHVSELADHKVEDPHKEVKIGERIQVKILRVDPVDRKIGLSKKRAEWSADQEGESGGDRKVKPRRGGLHGAGEQTTDLIPQMALSAPKTPQASPADEDASVGEDSSAETSEAPKPDDAEPTPEASADAGDSGDAADTADVGDSGDVADTAADAGDSGDAVDTADVGDSGDAADTGDTGDAPEPSGEKDAQGESS